MCQIIGYVFFMMEFSMHHDAAPLRLGLSTPFSEEDILRADKLLVRGHRYWRWRSRQPSGTHSRLPL